MIPLASVNLAKIMVRVCNDHAPIITHESGGSVVLNFLEDYNAMTETYYLLVFFANARGLLNSIAELGIGKSVVRELVE